MEHHVGIDVSPELGSLRADVTGKVIREAKVASEPEALAALRRAARGRPRAGVDKRRTRVHRFAHAADVQASP